MRISRSSLGVAIVALLLVAPAQAQWDFQYSYDSVLDANADQYNQSVVNAVKSNEGGTSFWQPAPGNLNDGVITMRFAFANPVVQAHMFANLPTFHWAYGQGHNQLHASRDGVNWILLLDVPTPAFAQANSGGYNQDLPASLIGGREIWVRATLSNTSTNPGITAFRNTAQFSRFHPTREAFSFDANFFGFNTIDPGGNIFFFDDIFEGDDGAETIDLSSIHRLGVQSITGVPPSPSKSNTIRRMFVFEPDGGSTDPINVFIDASLDGFLQADNSSNASVGASIALNDLLGNTLGNDSVARQVSAGINQNQQADVLESLGFSALLTPGQTYELVSTLNVAAQSSIIGAARSFFDSTFEVNISTVPEPSSLMLFGWLWLIVVVAARRRHVAY